MESIYIFLIEDAKKIVAKKAKMWQANAHH